MNTNGANVSPCNTPVYCRLQSVVISKGPSDGDTLGVNIR